MSGVRIIAEGPLPGPDFERLPGVDLIGGPLAELLTEPRPGVEAAIVLGGRVDVALLDLLPDLRVISRFGVGYDAIDVAACTEREVWVAVTPGPVEAATAELAVALTLAVRRDLLAADARTRAAGWAPPVTELPAQEGIHASTVGLVGLGRIGRRVALALGALGARIVYTSRHRVPAEVEAELGATYLSLEELCAASDVVSVHCPLTAGTRGLIGPRQLALVRDGGAIVNTARGPIVDEDALVAEVTAGRLAAGLDVFADEPHVPEELRRSPHVVLSPHLGSATRAARAEMTRIAVDDVLAVLAGERPAHPVAEQEALGSTIGRLRGS